MSAPFGSTIRGNDWSDLPAEYQPRSVSVVIVHYEQHRQLERTLAGIRSQTYPADLIEVVVSDDGSSRLPEVPDGVTLITQPDDGFRLALARNRGAAASGGDILCFLDADTTPEPQYVERAVRLATLAPDVVVVGSRRHADFSSTPTDSPVSTAGPAHALASPAWLDEAYRASGNLLRADDRSYRFIIGAVLTCSRWLFDAVGGFDERSDAYGGEDWEWANRAWLAGAAFAHEPHAVAWHDGPDWAERRDGATRRADVDRARRKNDETLRLVTRIGVPGSAPRALVSPAADVLVRLATPTRSSTALVWADRILQGLPTARILDSGGALTNLMHDSRIVSEAPDEFRVSVHCPVPVMFADAALHDLAQATTRVGRDDVARVELAGSDVVVTVVAERAARRDARWGVPHTASAWHTDRVEVSGLLPLPDPVDVEAYLGGWWP